MGAKKYLGCFGFIQTGREENQCSLINKPSTSDWFVETGTKTFTIINLQTVYLRITWYDAQTKHRS